MSKSFQVLVTEQQNPKTRHIDTLSTEQIIRAIHNEDKQIPDAIEKVLPDIAIATDKIVANMQNGGRILYIGAGTSGRLGILDASECPPTFGTDPDQIIGIIAGGEQAIREAVEGAEDREDLGVSDIQAYRISNLDVLIGIAASGRTPYVLGAMKHAKQIGATVIGVTNNEHSLMEQIADVVISAVVGPEVILGSTRMKAGTAQKQILNMLSTASMIKLGKVYDNLMVDMQPSNEKLVNRAKRIIQMATQAKDDEVEKAFLASGGHVKTAVIMILMQVDANQAQLLLKNANGFVHQAVQHNA